MRQDVAMSLASAHYHAAIGSGPAWRLWTCSATLCVVLAACAQAPKGPAPAPVTSAMARAIPGANDVLMRTLGLIGTPYRWGGNTPDGGFDCSGLVHYVFLDAANLGLPRTSQQMSEIDVPGISRNRLEPGDLVFFGLGRKVSHVGIYVGEGRFVHAPNEGGTVRIDPLDGHYWRDHYLFARRPLAGR